MLHHVSVGAGDLARVTRFYDAALAPLGMERTMEFGDAAVAYGAKGRADLWVQLPLDGQPAGGTDDGQPARGRNIPINITPLSCATPTETRSRRCGMVVNVLL